MKKLATLFILILLAAALAGCNLLIPGEGGLRGSGKLVSEARAVSGIRGVHMACAGKLNITQGDSESLRISGDGNLLKLFKTEMRDGVLYIETLEEYTTYTPQLGITFDLEVIELASLAVSGSGEVVMGNLITDLLEVTVSGSGEVSLGGQAREQAVLVSGSGSYRAAELESQIARVTVSGSGSAEVWVLDELTATVQGSGSIDHWGPAAVRRGEVGAGNVNNRGDK